MGRKGAKKARGMKSFAFFSLGCLFLTLSVCCWQVSLALVQLPARVDRAIAREREVILEHLVTTEKRLDARLGSIQADARRLIRAESDQTRREALAVADRHLSTVSGALVANLHGITDSVNRLSVAYAVVPDRVAGQTSRIWDCEANPDCLENRYVSVSRAVEASARAISAQTPRVAAAIERGAAASERTAEAAALSTERTAKLVDNLERQTRPLPAPLGLALRVLAPLATPVVLGVTR